MHLSGQCCTSCPYIIHMYSQTACNGVWPYLVRCFGVLKCHDTEKLRRDKGKKGDKVRKEKPETQQQPAQFCGGWCWPFLLVYLGILTDFRHLGATNSKHIDIHTYKQMISIISCVASSRKQKRERERERHGEQESE